MRVIFAGTPASAVPVLQALIDSPEHEVVAVFTRRDAPKGRSKKLVLSPVGEVAEAHNIPTFKPPTLRKSEHWPPFAELNADAIIVVAYGLIIPKELLEVVKHGWINLHYSLLPQLRGAAPVQQALIAGLSETGVSIFQIAEGLDTGPLLAQKPVEIPDGCSSDELLTLLNQYGIEQLMEVLSGLADGTLQAWPQPQLAPEDESLAVAQMLTKEGAQIPWSAAWQQVRNHIRGYTSNPGAWTRLADGTRVVVQQVEPLSEDKTQLPPGALQIEKKRVLVGTGTDTLELVKVVPAGKKPMAAADWARGLRLEAPAFQMPEGA